MKILEQNTKRFLVNKYTILNKKIVKPKELPLKVGMVLYDIHFFDSFIESTTYYPNKLVSLINRGIRVFKIKTK